MPDTFQNRLNLALEARKMKPAELSRKTGFSKAKISQYTNGIYEAKQDGLYKIAQALNVSIVWLMGHDVPMERTRHEVCSDQATIFDQVSVVFGEQSVELLNMFNQLNEEGQKKALENLADLSMIQKYKV